MINAAVNAVSAGLDQMQTSGSLGSTSLTFSSGLLSKANEGIIVGTDSPIYRRALIEYDVGAN
jgi:hypothetical protein